MADLDAIIESVRRDFTFLAERALGVLLFGSWPARGRGRDVDVCVVAPREDPHALLFEIFRRVDVRGRGYDVRIFEELPIYLRREVILGNHPAICRDVPALAEYFYFQRKFCADLDARRRKAEAR